MKNFEIRNLDNSINSTHAYNAICNQRLKDFEIVYIFLLSLWTSQENYHILYDNHK